MKDFYQKGKANVIIDGQYGSTGKGLIAGYFARHSVMPQGHVVHTTNAAPNAGHTTMWREEVGEHTIEPGRVKKLVLFHLPTGGVLRNELCYINAGAVVDIALFVKERANAEHVMGYKPHIQIHPNAVILDPGDVDTEGGIDSKMTKISSTRKGVGAAIARKVRREADLMDKWRLVDPLAAIKTNKLHFNDHLRHGQSVVIEVPQGLSLGLNHGGFYPYCTSREVSVAQALSDANIHPKWLGLTALCMRAFPIRVGSLPGTTSGGHYHDQREMQWHEFPVDEPEITTVTKRPRRIFSWSRNQYRDALAKTMPAVVFLNFVNYFGSTLQFFRHVQAMQEDHDSIGIKPMIVYGLGPMIEDVVDDYDEAERRLSLQIAARGDEARAEGNSA